MRGVALGGALVGGGFLFDVWKPFPFLIAALVTTTACGAAIALLRESPTGSRVFEGVRAYVAAVGAGALGDGLALARVIFLASWLYGGGLLLGGYAQAWHDWYYAVVFPVAVAGGTVMALSWGLLFKLMPERDRGAISGLATTTKGLGLLVGGKPKLAADGSRRPAERERPEAVVDDGERGHDVRCPHREDVVVAALAAAKRAVGAGDALGAVAEAQTLPRPPAARLPERVDRNGAAVPELDRGALLRERAVGEVPRRQRAGAAPPEASAPRGSDVRLHGAELEAAEAAARH